MKKKSKNSINIPKKVMLGVAPAIAIIAILISKHQPGPLVLFLTGIAAAKIKLFRIFCFAKNRLPDYSSSVREIITRI